MNKSELEHIAAAYYEEIYLFCLRKVNYDEHLARDLVQDVFLLLLERHGGLTNTNLLAWLYSVADKKIKEAYKKEKKNQKLFSIDHSNQEIPCDSDILTLLENSITDDEIAHGKTQVLSSLAPKEMELYTKIYMEHKQYHTIATELQTTEKAIRLRAFRLRKRMKELSKIIFSSIGHF